MIGRVGLCSTPNSPLAAALLLLRPSAAVCAYQRWSAPLGGGTMWAWPLCSTPLGGPCGSLRPLAAFLAAALPAAGDALCGVALDGGTFYLATAVLWGPL